MIAVLQPVSDYYLDMIKKIHKIVEYGFSRCLEGAVSSELPLEEFVFSVVS
ncbi:MAG: hypothetical protein WAM14_02910 [Candidatus Nitrosopolaris sp.]